MENKAHLTAQQERDLIISLEANKELLPYLPDLLSDLWELGSFPSLYVDMLRSLSLNPKETKVLDLGTGKGAVAVTLAQALGFYTVGVDLTDSFLEDAKRQALKRGVAEHCKFYHEDIREMLKKAHHYDLVIFVSMGGLLGNWKKTVGHLRKTVRPGGYILIDDGFYKEGGHVEKIGYGHYASYSKTFKALTTYGDTLIKEIIHPDAEVAAKNRDYMTAIKKRSLSLSKAHPEIAESLRWYIWNQEEECQILESSITGACWLLQRHG